MADARFEDGGEKPLRLKALDPEDLAVLSSLVQDAVFPASEMVWTRRDRRFAVLLNRFRWEDADGATTRARAFERVRSVLLIEDVLKVQSQGVPRGDAATVMSLLSLTFEPGADGAGRVILTLAGDGAIALEVEAFGQGPRPRQMMVRPLTAADALAFRQIRLEALRLHPEAYGSTLAEWERLPQAAYVARIEDGVIFGLFTEKGLDGILAYDRLKGGHERHRAGIHAVYVRKPLRGKGGADLLLSACVERARADGVVQLELAVAETNTRAQDFYARHGFARYAVSPRALLVKNRYLDELHLIRRLDA
jgi:ribosomal protein S18 acetylase RimI-like enzyme